MPGTGTRTQYGTAKPKPRTPARPLDPRRNWSPERGNESGSLGTTVYSPPDTQWSYYAQQSGIPGSPFAYGVERARLEAQNPLGAGTAPGLTSFGGGGGGRGGGGGGGGGAPAITQAMIDAMTKALGAQVAPLNMTAQPLPAFRGQALGAFNAQPYTQALGQINQAVTADRSNIATNQGQVAQQLQNSYSNPYASATVAAAPQATPQAAGLQGGAADPAAAQQVNAAGAGDQAAFQNLMQVLGAANQASQQSRMAQVGMDANYANQQLGAQALGLRGGVNTAQAQAQNQWTQAQRERSYQNSLMQQQWLREDTQRRQDLANQNRQSNWTQANQTMTSRLQPILDLISQSAGVPGLNFDPLLKILGGIR